MFQKGSHNIAPADHQFAGILFAQVSTRLTGMNHHSQLQTFQLSDHISPVPFLFTAYVPIGNCPRISTLFVEIKTVC